MTVVRANADDTSAVAGFSLVEMLVGLCIVAILGGLLAVAIAQLGQIRRITETVETETDVAYIVHYLDDLIANARSLPLISQDPNNKVVFEGNPDGMRLVSVARISSGNSSLRDIEIVVRQLENDLQIVQKNSPRRLYSTPQQEEFVIARGMKSVQFRYLRSAENENHWVDTWPDVTSLPAVIGLKLVTSQSGRDRVIDYRLTTIIRR